MGTQHPEQGGQAKEGTVQESYIKSLIQQIKILELETEYLKNQNPDSRRGVQLMAGKSSKETEAEESLTKLKAELQAAMAKIESVKLEKQKMMDRPQMEKSDKVASDPMHEQVNEVERLVRVHFEEVMGWQLNSKLVIIHSTCRCVTSPLTMMQ